MIKQAFSAVAIVVIFISIGTGSVIGQRRGKICGDPTLPCRGSEGFSAWELKFAIPENAVIYESEPFYAVILKSVKIKEGDDCAKAISEEERLATQQLFERNKVFAMNCFEAGSISYSNVANDVGFMAIFGGKTQTQAKAILAKIKETGKFPGAMIRRMHALVNGT